MKFSEFIKTFNDNLVSVSDNNQYYDKSQLSEIADREVEKITYDEMVFTFYL